MKASCIIRLLLLLALAKQSTAQITPADFRLCLDQLGCFDSALKLTKQTLLGAQKLHPNFSWFTIETMMVFIGSQHSSDTYALQVKGSILTAEVKKVFERLSPGGIVVIEVLGHNAKDQPVPWASLGITIVR